MKKIEGVYRHESARRLADLSGVEADLDLVIRACDLFACTPVLGSDDAILMSRSLGTFALVTYCRTLESRVRIGIPSRVIQGLPHDLKLAHDSLKAMRDKYVTHSVNLDEGNQVDVTLQSDASGNLRLDALGTSHSRVAGFTHEEMLSLRAVATALKAWASGEWDRERDALWDVLDAMDPNEVVAALSETRPVGHPERAKTRRVYGSAGDT
jgi:hypothetical protein